MKYTQPPKRAAHRTVRCATNSPLRSRCLRSRFDLFLCRVLDFEFPRLRLRLGNRNLHFQNSVGENGVRLLGLCAFRQRYLPIEAAVIPLGAVEALALLFFFFLAFA